MKKFLVAALAAALLCFGALALAGCGDNGGSTETPNAGGTDEPTQQAYTLIVGFDAEYPPYGFMADDGSYTGFDLDLAAEVCKRNGWEFKAVPIDWDSKDAQLNSGVINCIWNGFTLEGREGQYAFSYPYMLNAQVIVTKAGSDIKSFADLAGKAVLTQADSAALSVLQDEEGQAALAATFKSLDTIGDYNNAFMQLEAGIVDAVACDLSIAAYQMAANPSKYVQLDTPLSEEHYAVGFKLGDDEHANAVSQTLLAMYKDGTAKTICDKYAEYDLDFSNWCLK